MKNLNDVQDDKSQALRSFPKDVANHTMEVLMDSPPYRHISFSNKGSSVYRFDLVTWPGHLSISGDMGSFTFSRLEDMFEFFRTDRRGIKEDTEEFDVARSINLGYWKEKLVAVDPGGCEKYSPRMLRDAVMSYFEDEDDLKERYGEEALESIKSEALDIVDQASRPEEVQDALSKIYHFDCEDFEFTDFFEYNLKEPSYHFVWCCAAIAHGVRQYDLMAEQKAENTAKQPSRNQAAKGPSI